MAADLIILVGIPGSGKTTFCRRHLQDHLHVSLDNWRGKNNVRQKEYQAVMAGLAAAAEERTAGVVVDNTNTTAATRKRYFDYARQFSQSAGQEVKLTAYWFDEPLSACLDRNRRRPTEVPAGQPYFVPPAAIVSFYRMLQPPSYDEGFREIFRVHIDADGQFAVEPVEATR